MPSKYRVRAFFAPLVKLLAQAALKIGLSPNHITWGMLGSAGVALVGYLVLPSWGALIWFASWIFITGLLDGVDGALARLANQQSPTGGFFDSTMDRISEGVIFMGLLLGPYPEFSSNSLYIVWRVVVFVGYLASVMISYTRARTEVIAQTQGITLDTNIGMFGRSERLLSLIGWAVLTVLIPTLGSLILFLVLMMGFLAMFVYRLFSYRHLIIASYD